MWLAKLLLSNQVIRYMSTRSIAITSKVRTSRIGVCTNVSPFRFLCEWHMPHVKSEGMVWGVELDANPLSAGTPIYPDWGYDSIVSWLLQPPSPSHSHYPCRHASASLSGLKPITSSVRSIQNCLWLFGCGDSQGRKRIGSSSGRHGACEYFLLSSALWRD